MAICGLLLTSCSGGDESGQLPREADIARLEAQLARHPCVGSLDRWERNYRFAVNKGVFAQERQKPNFELIQFHFREAGRVEIAATRNLVPTGDSGAWPESRLIRTLDGVYQVKSGRVSIARCKPVQG